MKLLFIRLRLLWAAAGPVLQGKKKKKAYRIKSPQIVAKKRDLYYFLIVMVDLFSIYKDVRTGPA